MRKGCWAVLLGLILFIYWLVDLCSRSILVHFKERSAQTSVCAATLTYKLLIKLSILPSHSIMTLGWPVPALTLQHQAPSRVATGVPVFKSLLWLDLEKGPQGKWESNCRSAALEVDTFTLCQRGSLGWKSPHDMKWTETQTTLVQLVPKFHNWISWPDYRSGNIQSLFAVCHRFYRCYLRFFLSLLNDSFAGKERKSKPQQQQPVSCKTEEMLNNL